jgi:hypothetical protein
MMRRYLTQSRGNALPASKLAAALARCTAGVSAVEFALVSPIFLTMLTGLFDLGQMVYAKSVLSGAVQQAARDSSLETADTTRADRIVRGIVGPILPGTAIITTRVSYYDFADIGRKERWNDLNNNGTCDNNESYVDENRSTHWEADIGVSGNGGAGDVVLYTATAQYSPIFKIPFAPYNWNQRNLTATAVRKNQPFADQTRYGASSGTCA